MAHCPMVARDQIALLVSSKLARRSLRWRYQSRGHRTLNNVPLDQPGRCGSKQASTSCQYRATIMIATTMNAAISERTRSSVIDPGFAAVLGGGMAYVGGCSSPANQPTAQDF